MLFDVIKKEVPSSGRFTQVQKSLFKRILILGALTGMVWQIAIRWETLKAVFLELRWANGLIGIGLVIGLMGINLALESSKWNSLLRHRLKTSSWQRLRAICAGLTFGMFTPNRIGEYGGRVLFFPKSTYSAILTSSIGANLVQFVINVLGGLYGAILILKIIGTNFAGYMVSAWTLQVVFIGALLAVIGILSILLFFPVFRAFLQRISMNVQDQIADWNWRTLVECASICLLRLFVICLQFFLLLDLFGNAPPLIEGLLILAGLFAIQTLLPMPSLASLALRTEIAFLLFDMEGGSILLASYLLWIINIFFPALWGLLGLAIWQQQTKTINQ